MSGPTAAPAPTGSGTPDDPWTLTTPPGRSEYQAYRDKTADPDLLSKDVGRRALRRGILCVHGPLCQQGAPVQGPGNRPFASDRALRPGAGACDHGEVVGMVFGHHRQDAFNVAHQLSRFVDDQVGDPLKAGIPDRSCPLGKAEQRPAQRRIQGIAGGGHGLNYPREQPS